MLTITETKEVRLDTPDEIAAYLTATFSEMVADSPFKSGEAVAFTSRGGLHQDIAIGDVGVMLCDLPRQPWSWVLVFTSSGQPMAVQVQTANLAKREPTEEDEA